jgi:hypothetical protein
VEGEGDIALEPGGAGPLDQDALGDAEDAPEGAPTALIRIDGMDVPPGAAGAPGAAPSVDELFARIRAGAADADADDDSQKTDPGPVSDATADSGAGPMTPAAPEAAAGAGAMSTGAATSGGEPAATQAVLAVEVVEVVEEAPGPDDPLIARRDELLEPVTARLSRTVKRTLGDNQNRLLDRIRSGPSLTIDELLGPEDEQLSLFASAVRGQLAEAFAAGTMFAGAGAAVPHGDAVDHSSTALSRVVVTMLRRRMEEGSDEAGDRIGAAFREWRGERVDRLAGDYATQAFSAGVTAAGSEHKLRWVVTSSEGCSDCADNALAGAVSTHESFPTGHLHPPAHSGCRCLVAPTDA